MNQYNQNYDLNEGENIQPDLNDPNMVDNLENYQDNQDNLNNEEYQGDEIEIEY